MSDLRPIETVWRGWRFRSRTEARWAVALTEAGKKFEYEAQGFDLPSGWYLPDFWLPEDGTWLEVKGKAPNERERALAAEMAAAGQDMLIAVGPPDPDEIYLLSIDSDGRELERQFWLPDEAYRAAREERFDGKPVGKAADQRFTMARGWRP